MKWLADRLKQKRLDMGKHKKRIREEPPHEPESDIIREIILALLGVLVAVEIDLLAEQIPVDSRINLIVTLGLIILVLAIGSVAWRVFRNRQKRIRKAEESSIRERTLKNVRKWWIQDILKKSQQALIPLDFKIIDVAVKGPRDPTTGSVGTIPQPNRVLGDIPRVFAKFGDELLILGVAGAGKR